ncbi:hypothetical protein KPH14_007642 [Odynerus spinipes]|uniref:CCHC-type domain-containing protein n=1 Tax=Odynerus spinipes TaxID=1348599 RepID=A0AAD9VN99_9HYME|nr:hypothetical protein KPH14_007642 [Odynerus spinipes]
MPSQQRVKAFFEPKTLNVLLELLREFFAYSWKASDTVGTFVAGLKVIARKIEALESEDFGKKFNEKLLMAKILDCLPEVFNSFVISWSLLSNEISLETFLEKLSNAERSVKGKSDDLVHDAYNTHPKPKDNKPKNVSGKKFRIKCYNCGKLGHHMKNCWSEGSKQGTTGSKQNSVKKDATADTGLSASSVFCVGNTKRIIADSGASVHLTRNIEWLSSPLILNIADGKTMKATQKSIDGKKWEKRTWESVFYSKDMSSESLFSTKFMEKTKNYGFYHGNGIMRLMDGQKIVLGGKRLDNQYVPFICVILPPVSIDVAQSIGVWHQRFGHRLSQQQYIYAIVYLIEETSIQHHTVSGMEPNLMLHI